MNNKTLYTLLVSALLMLVSQLAIAAPYNNRDVDYITPSRDWDVIDYVICLQQEVADSKRSVRFDDALDDAAFACDNAGYILPASRSEPTARMIRQFIVSCGFRPEEALAGSRCGGRDRAGARTRRAAPTRCTPPQVMRNGKCRAPVVVNTTPRCRSPLVFRNGKCRTPAITNTTPRCRSPLVFRNGKCRSPAITNTTPRCPSNKVFRNGKCR